MNRSILKLFQVWLTLVAVLGVRAYAGHFFSLDNGPQDGRRPSGNIERKIPQSLKKTKSLTVQNKLAYGILLFDDVEEDKTNCFVSFNLPNVQTFNKLQNLGMYTSAGAYAEGKYYFSDTKVVNETEVPGKLYEITISTGRVTPIGSFSGFENYIADMSYDYATKTMYAVARLKNASDISALYKINLKDATSEKVANMDRYFYTLACSYGGQLYGISRTGDFCKINKTTGAVEKIGATGLAPTYMQTMEFDHTDKTLYWAAVLMPDGSMTSMTTIDLKTGLASMVGNLGNAAEVIGLYIPFTASGDATPAAVSAMSVEPGKNGLLEATLQWVNPSQTFGGGALDGTLKVEIYRNDVLIETKSNPKPGEKETYLDKITGTTGLSVKYKVIPVNSAGKGVAKESTVFVGKDLPAAPTNLSVIKSATDRVKLSWVAPTTGKNGGWTDLGSLTYKVVRMPDNKVIAENLKTLTCEDMNITPAATYTYQVISVNTQGEGEFVESSGYVLGPKLVLPYYGDFGKSDVMKTWTIIDNNEDNFLWKNSYYSSLKKNVMIFQSSTTLDADDWLVSHTFPLVEGQTYKVSFIIQALVGNNLRFVLGRDTKIEALTEEIAKYEKIVYSNLTPLNFTFVAKETGDFNLGIQLYSAKNSSWTYLTDVNVEPIVPIDMVAVSLNGNVNPIVGNTYEYEFTVRNRGTQAQSNYTLCLKDALQDSVLVTKKMTEKIEPEAEKSFVLSWKATSEKITGLTGQVICPDEEILINNLTDTLNIRVQPAGSSEIIDIAGTSSSKLHPFNFYETKSAAMNIYMADEIKHNRGVIEKLVYSYNSGWSKDVENTPVKVYLGNTERTNTLGGFIREDSLLLVYDGTVTIKKGENILEIPLDKYLVYEGKNLAVLTIQSMPTGYANSINFPCYVSKQEKNVALLWKGYKDPFNFTMNGTQGVSNSAIRFDMLCDGAMISGKVEDVNIPLDSVSVTLKERKTTITTDSEGNFVFNYVPDGTYTLLCSRHGYPDEEVGNIKVVNKQNVVQNIRMTNLPAYKLRGKVVDAKGQPLSNVLLELSGYEKRSTVTSEDGTFEFLKILSATGYNLVIRKEYYKPLNRMVDMTKDVDLATQTLDYFVYSPVNVSPEVKDGVATVKWETPDKPVSFRKDDGTVSGQTGITNGTGKVVMGVVHRTPALVTDVSWFTTYEGGPHNIMHLFIYDLDEAGNPVNNVLCHVENIKNSDNTWTTYKLPEPVEAPNGFMIALNYPGFIGIGVDSGKNPVYPFENKTYSFSANYENGKFDYLEGKGLDKNLLIRASGYVMADNLERTVKAEPVSVAADFWTYKVWRLAGKDTDTPEKWTLLTQNPITTTYCEDPGLNALSPDVYRYAVSIVYPDGKVSRPMLSQYVAHNMITNVTVKAKTNGQDAKAQGATVVLKNEKGETLTQTIDDNNQARFADVWKGKYKLFITMQGYEEISKDLDFSLNNDYVTEEYLLKEQIVKPKNLSAKKDGQNVLFSWNNSDNMMEDFESHSDFAINSAGKLGWQYIDGDGGETFCFRNYRFPGEIDPKAYIVFNPSATIPPMTDAKIQPHSGSRFLSSFSADTESGVNDDYLISPELRFVEDFTLSFYAKSYSNANNYTDPFCVGYSKTGIEPENFEWIADNVIPGEENWEKYTYKIPAEARFVTIRNVATNGFVLMIDDIFIGHEASGKIPGILSGTPQFKYHVYLDGAKVAETADCSYMFRNVSAGKHTAGVKTVYYSGASELATCDFEFETGIHSETISTFRIYPNPAREQLMVEGEYTHLELNDLSGRPIARYEAKQSRIDVSGLAEGLYILVAIDENTPGKTMVKFRVAR